MRVTTWTEYSLIISLHLARRAGTGSDPLAARELADAERLPADYVEQILLRLRRAGHRRQWPGLDGDVAGDHGFRGFDLRGAAGEQDEGEGGQGAVGGDHARRVRHRGPFAASAASTFST